MANPRSIVALLTDFGTRDPYVAAMKGVIASRSTADILDLSHEIASFDPFEAGWFLRSMRTTFDGSSGVLDHVVIVAVVDPGVGTERRILAAYDGGITFLAPDNGLLSVAVSSRAAFVAVENHALFLPNGSTTFHGRDRFAPVAAALAEGEAGFEDLGPPVNRAEIVDLGYRAPRWDESMVTGTIVAIDKFGNLVTDIEASRLGPWHKVEALVGSTSITTLRETYGGSSSSEPFLIVGSLGTIEISLNRERAADRLQCQRLDEIQISF